jgi:hypothetical protein
MQPTADCFTGKIALKNGDGSLERKELPGINLSSI